MFIGRCCRSNSQTRRTQDLECRIQRLVPLCSCLSAGHSCATAAHRTLSYYTVPTESLPSHDGYDRTMSYHMTLTAITVPQLLQHGLALSWLLQQGLTNHSVRYYHVMLLYQGLYISCRSNKDIAMSWCSNRNIRNNSQLFTFPRSKILFT